MIIIIISSCFLFLLRTQRYACLNRPSVYEPYGSRGGVRDVVYPGRNVPTFPNNILTLLCFSSLSLLPWRWCSMVLRNIGMSLSRYAATRPRLQQTSLENLLPSLRTRIRIKQECYFYPNKNNQHTLLLLLQYYNTTPCSRVLPEKLKHPKLLKKFPVRNLISLFHCLGRTKGSVSKASCDIS